jgi:hypothetical protein
VQPMCDSDGREIDGNINARQLHSNSARFSGSELLTLASPVVSSSLGFVFPTSATLNSACAAIGVSSPDHAGQRVLDHQKEELSERRFGFPVHVAPHIRANDVKLVIEVSLEHLMRDFQEIVYFEVNNCGCPFTQKAKIDFPAGVWSGHCRSKPELGSVGDDGVRGNLVLEVQEKKHPKGFYRCIEDRPEDVHLDVEIAWSDFMSPGHSIMVPTLLDDEMVKVDVPTEFQGGDIVKLKNYGFPVLYRQRPIERGDQVVHLRCSRGSGTML